jgi:hypothetical protein
MRNCRRAFKTLKSIITYIKFLFPYPKPFLDICYTYDGLVSTILSRLAYVSRDFFLNVAISFIGNGLLMGI